MLIKIETIENKINYIDVWNICEIKYTKKDFGTHDFISTDVREIIYVDTYSHHYYEINGNIKELVKRINNARKNMPFSNKPVKISRAELLDIGD